jgi:hypothetical protein
MKKVSFVLVVLFALPLMLISGATTNATYWEATGFSDFNNVNPLPTITNLGLTSVASFFYPVNQSDCSVDISSEYSIQSYLEQGLRTEDNGGSTITYKTISEWNTVGLEIRFDNGNVVKGINVNIRTGYTSAKISVDFPSIGYADYYLYSNGVLKSADGSFTYKCR